MKSNGVVNVFLHDWENNSVESAFIGSIHYSEKLVGIIKNKMNTIMVHLLAVEYIADKCVFLASWLRNLIVTLNSNSGHDDVIKWKHFPGYWPFVRGIHRSPVNSPQKGQWRGALMFSLICSRINDWVNNREAGDLRRRRAHYDVKVMFQQYHFPVISSIMYQTISSCDILRQ